MILNKQLIRMLTPQISPALEGGQKELKKYLDSIPLEPGETSANILIDFDGDNAILVVCTFKGKVLNRNITHFKKERLFELIEKL